MSSLRDWDESKKKLSKRTPSTVLKPKKSSKTYWTPIENCQWPCNSTVLHSRCVTCLSISELRNWQQRSQEMEDWDKTWAETLDLNLSLQDCLLSSLWALTWHQMLALSPLLREDLPRWDAWQSSSTIQLLGHQVLVSLVQLKTNPLLADSMTWSMTFKSPLKTNLMSADY